MPNSQRVNSQRVKGLALAAIGGLALTFDIPLIRLSQADQWSSQIMRALLIIPVSVLIWWCLRTFAGVRESMMPGRLSWAVMLSYGVSSLLFFSAVFNTTTANLVFILAFNPMLSALFSWILFRERPAPQTFFAMTVMIAGVFIIVQDGLAAGKWYGDLCALGGAATIAMAIAMSRLSTANMGYAALLSQFIPLIFALGTLVTAGSFNVPSPWWLVLNGAVIIPISFFCLGAAPRYIGGAETAIFYLLETVLTPVWVWLIFNDTPSNQALLGGAVLLVALVAHTIWELRRERAVFS
jgi:drug/metabolite transporter (DMT)-like permease